MATVNKDFKVKNGLIVEGTTAKVNNFDILTKKQADQDYIVSLIGGTATPDNTPDTVVKRDGDGSFAAGTITVDQITLAGVGYVQSSNGDVIIANTDENDVQINAWDVRINATDDVRVTADDLIRLSTTNGIIDLVATDGNVYVNGDAPSNKVATQGYVDDAIGNIDLTFNTDEITEGSTNFYYTDTRARQALSEGTGINYDNTTGTISADLADFDTDDLTEGASNKYFTTGRIDNHLSGGDGITYSAGTISADVAGGLHIDNAQVKIDRTTVDTWYDANGAAGDVQDNLNDHTGASSGVHGITSAVVGTTDSQTLTNKTIGDELAFGEGTQNYIGAGGVDNADLTVNAESNLTLSTNNGDIVLDADGGVYVGSVSAGNTVATNSYVDNAVSGLDWKNAVHLLYDAALPTLSGSGASQLIIDGHDPLGDSDSGYRVLVTQSSDAGIYVFNSTSGNWTLTRAEDADAFGELVGAAVFVMEGTQYGQTSWVQSNHYLSSFSGQSWTQFSGSGSVVAGEGITVDGLEVSIDRTTVDTWYDENGAAQDAVFDHNALTTGVHGVTGDVVGTSDEQTLTNKTIDGQDNTLQNIPNSALDNDSITVNGYQTALGSTVTLDTDDVSEGDNKYFTQARARQSLSAGTAINYDNTTGTISVDATELDTDDISEGTTNKYYTDTRVKSVLTSATQNNIVIEEVAGELIITAENGVDDSTTDDLEEGTTNLYHTSARAKSAAAELLTGATKTNITITGSGSGLTITAENGVADSDTDDLAEGSTNLYFTNARAVDAIEAVVPNFTEVDINSLATQVAATISVPTASIGNVAYSFAKADYRSAEFLVKTAYGNHTEISKVLLTLDSSDNIAITEYGTVGTNGATMNISGDIDGSNVRLIVQTLNNSSTVTVVGTLLA